LKVGIGVGIGVRIAGREFRENRILPVNHHGGQKVDPVVVILDKYIEV
jgi:hypothetical protein